MRTVDKARIEKIDIEIKELEELYKHKVIAEMNSKKKSFLGSKLIAYKIDVLTERRKAILTKYRVSLNKYYSFLNELEKRELALFEAKRELSRLRGEQETSNLSYILEANKGIDVTLNLVSDFKGFSQSIMRQENKIKKLEYRVSSWYDNAVKYEGVPEVIVKVRRTSKVPKIDLDQHSPQQRTQIEQMTREEKLAEAIRLVQYSKQQEQEVIETDKFHCVTNEPSEELINMLRRPTIEIENDLDIDVKFED